MLRTNDIVDIVYVVVIHVLTIKNTQDLCNGPPQRHPCKKLTIIFKDTLLCRGNNAPKEVFEPKNRYSQKELLLITVIDYRVMGLKQHQQYTILL